MLDVLNDRFAHIFEPELLEEICKSGKYVKVEAGEKNFNFSEIR